MANNKVNTPSVYNSFDYTEGGQFTLPDGRPYAGYYHKMSDGTYMTGRTQDNTSTPLIEVQKKIVVEKGVVATNNFFLNDIQLQYNIIRSKVGEVESVYIGGELEKEKVYESVTDPLLRDFIEKTKKKKVKKNNKGLTVVPIIFSKDKVLEENYYNLVPEKNIIQDDELRYYVDNSFSYFVSQEFEAAQGSLPVGTFLRIVGEGVLDKSNYTYYFVENQNDLLQVSNFETLQVMLLERNRTCDTILVLEQDDFKYFNVVGVTQDRSEEWIPRFLEESNCIESVQASTIDYVGNVITGLAGTVSTIIGQPSEELIDSTAGQAFPPQSTTPSTPATTPPSSPKPLTSPTPVITPPSPSLSVPAKSTELPGPVITPSLSGKPVVKDDVPLPTITPIYQSPSPTPSASRAKPIPTPTPIISPPVESIISPAVTGVLTPSTEVELVFLEPKLDSRCNQPCSKSSTYPIGGATFGNTFGGCDGGDCIGDCPPGCPCQDVNGEKRCVPIPYYYFEAFSCINNSNNVSGKKLIVRCKYDDIIGGTINFGGVCYLVSNKYIDSTGKYLYNIEVDKSKIFFKNLTKSSCQVCNESGGKFA